MVTRTETENPVVPLKDKRFVNIGSHPSNDVVITDEGVQPFHALLDCREEPYTLVPLSPDGEINLNGMQIPTHQVLQISPNDTLNLGNHRLRVLPASNGTPLRLAVASGQNTAEDVGILSGQVETELTGTAKDDVILASLDKNTAEVSVDQTAIFVLALGNGSPIVSTFHVQVDGIPDDWVLVSPANVNLNEGARGMVTIEITPPRRPTSTAGLHSVRFTITSHNHPDRRVTLPATLTIQPYYEYGISDLTPQRRRIGWGQKTGLVTMDVTNRGNNTAPFLFSAQDEENGCRFQFIDNDGLKQPGQVQYSIPPGDTHAAQIHISPIKRSLVRMRSQAFPYRVVTSQPENPALTLFTTGTAISAPLINALGLFLIAALLVGITGYLFTPRITYFKADNNLIGVGESTTLRWKTSPFTHNVAITGVEKTISGSQGAQQIFPASTVNTYTFTASTWLWSLLGLTPPNLPVTVLAVPGEPVISTFTVSAQEALVGDEVTLRWSVDNTDKLLLTINGVTETFEDSKDFNGERKLAIEKPTLISLEAKNSSGTVVDSKFIEVSQPSIVIDQFELSESTITTGDQVTISWKVSGTGMENGGEVTISAFDSVLPLEGQMTFFPKESMEFVLTARNRKIQESRILPVGVLEPGTPPAPPTIDFFTAAPDSLVGPGKVELAWSVSGAFDAIEISNGSEVVADDLAAQGFRTISVTKSGTYVLTATYVDESAGANLKITVDPALIKPNLTITSVYPENNLEMGDSAVVSVDISNPSVDDAPPTGKIVVTDGTSSCVIELPKTNCNLVFETPGVKSITASYQGDSLHVQTTSKPYINEITVLGNTISLATTILPSNLIYNFNQTVTARVVVNGTNPSRIPDGELRITRICDESGDAKYPSNLCDNEVIGYHKLTSADSASHKFTDLNIDQVGGIWKLQINFSGDSFYNPADQTAELKIDNAPRPVTLEIATPTDLPALAKKALTYTITAVDENAAGVYFVPNGNITLIATHSDGVTQQSCNSVTLVPTGDGRSSKAICTFTPSKSGIWSLSAEYKVATSTDIIHLDTSKTFPDLIVNSNTQASLLSAPADLQFSTSGTAEIKLVRDEDTTQAITNGTLSCSFPSGKTDGSCSCLFDSGSTWKCTLKPAPADTLPADKIITFSYSPPTNSYLNAQTLTHSLSIERAATIASISTAPQAIYQVESIYTFQISATHSTVGEPAPSSGKVTAYLGTGACLEDDGMKTGVLNPSTVDLGTTQSFTFDNTHQGKTLRVCYRYDGDDSHYSASKFISTPTFTVTAQSTSASITPQPESTYQVGGKYNITVNASRSGGSGTVSSGNVTIKLGTGTCNATDGMTSGVLSTWTNTVGAVKEIEFTYLHVKGQDIRFCARYDGNNGNLNASAWESSNALRVKAVPTWSGTSNVVVTASQNKDVKTQFSVVLNNAYSPLQSHVQVVLNDENSTLVCPSTASDTEKVCTLKSALSTDGGKTTTYTFEFASNTAKSWTVKPLYVATLTSTDVDSNNVTATGSTFAIQSLYDISIASVNTSAGCTACTSPIIWAYSSKEAASSDIMSTNLSTTLTVANFTTFDFEAAGFTAVVSGEKTGSTGLALDPDSSACTIANSTNIAGTQIGAVSCPQIRVTNSLISSFRIAVTPANSALFTTNPSATTATGLNIIQNIIEDPVDAAYGIKVSNGYCVGSDGKQQKYILEGFSAGPDDPSNALRSSDFTFQMRCEKDNDGDSDWDKTYTYTSNNSEFSALTWDKSVIPHKFSFTIAGNSGTDGYSGCESDADGIQFYLALKNPYATGINRDFEVFTWSTEELYLHDDKAGSDQAYDHCH